MLQAITTSGPSYAVIGGNEFKVITVTESLTKP